MKNVHTNVLLVVFSSISLKLCKSQECNLAQIFRTPKDRSKVNFDHFELIERTNFDEATTTETPKTSKNRDRNAKTVANAQVMLRFGGDDENVKNKICKSRFGGNGFDNHFHHGHYPFHPQMFPNHHLPCHPCYYHPYPPPVPYNFPNYYYYCPSQLPAKLEEYFEKHPVRKDNKNKEKICKAIKEERAEKACEALAEKLENKAHPKILKTVDLTEERVPCKIVEEVTLEECAKSPKANPDHIENFLSKAVIPFRERTDPNNPKLLITYPIIPKTTQCEDSINVSTHFDDLTTCHNQNTINEPCSCKNCDCCKRNPDVPFGKRFSSDLDNLLALAKIPPHSSSEAYRTSAGCATCVSQNNLQEPRVTFNGYSTDNGAGYYADPSKVIYYNAPSKADFVQGNNDYYDYKRYTKPEEVAVVCNDESIVKNQPTYFKAVPKYDVIPKYDIVPKHKAKPVEILVAKPLPEACKSVDDNLEVVRVPLRPKIEDYRKIYGGNSPYNNVEYYNRYCPMCAKETRQLNDW